MLHEEGNQGTSPSQRAAFRSAYDRAPPRIRSADPRHAKSTHWKMIGLGKMLIDYMQLFFLE
jgi:hypothetical protein